LQHITGDLGNVGIFTEHDLWRALDDGNGAS
jgi:hypothetical protein